MTPLEIGLLLVVLAALGAAGFFAQHIFAAMQAGGTRLPPASGQADKALPAAESKQAGKSPGKHADLDADPPSATPTIRASAADAPPSAVASKPTSSKDEAKSETKSDSKKVPTSKEDGDKAAATSAEVKDANAGSSTSPDDAAQAADLFAPAPAPLETKGAEPSAPTSPATSGVAAVTAAASADASTDLEDLFDAPPPGASTSLEAPPPSASSTVDGKTTPKASASGSGAALFTSAALSDKGDEASSGARPVGSLFAAPGAPKEPMSATGSGRISLFAPPSKPGESGGKNPIVSASKREDNEAPVAIKPQPMPQAKPSAARDPAAERAEEKERYRKGLTKTRKGFVARLADLFRGKPKVTADLKEEIEEVLFKADVGTKTAQQLLDRVSQVLDRSEIADPDAVWDVIRQTAREIFARSQAEAAAPKQGPYVMLMIGVNGVGKTTTLGKLAARHARDDKKVLLVAGDTFRAAAQEQLDVWARRVGCEIHMGEDKADPSAVIFEGITRGVKEGFDVILCDTAGRLHTRKELMDELEKIRRSAAKALSKALGASDAEAIQPTDIFLALDATIGQNALQQAALFKETLGFTGLVLTKLDGTAKGGVVLGVCDELSVPIRYIGIGEAIDDLRDFDADTFVDALLSTPGDTAEA